MKERNDDTMMKRMKKLLRRIRAMLARESISAAAGAPMSPCRFGIAVRPVTA